MIPARRACPTRSSANSHGGKRPTCRRAPSSPPSRGSAIAASIGISRFCRSARRPRCRRFRPSRPRGAISQHLVAAWEAALPDAPIREQQVVLTVPASFDASGRELTREAALAAGLPDDLVLLEEPQAAVYAWLADRGDAWRRELKVGDTLLVCDVGGGTTDLTLDRRHRRRGRAVAAADRRRQSHPRRRRQHGSGPRPSMTGAFKEKKIDLDPWQSVSLWHSCRTAKETLFAADGPKKHPVTVLGRGSKLIGGTVSVDLDRKAASALLLDGFFPACKLTDKPAQQRASGFRELGPAVRVRHGHHAASGGISRGARRSRRLARSGRRTLLFNGGVFKADLLARAARRRDRRLVRREGRPASRSKATTISISPSPAARPTTARPSRAAASAFAAAPRARITSASRRPAWRSPARRGRCGRCASCRSAWRKEPKRDVPSDEIGLVVGEPAAFRFFSSAVRKQDKPGDLLASWTEDELSETDSLEATLPPAAGSRRPLRAGPLPFEDHRAGRLRAVVRQHDLGPSLEAGVQRARGCGLSRAFRKNSIRFIKNSVRRQLPSARNAKPLPHWSM